MDRDHPISAGPGGYVSICRSSPAVRIQSYNGSLVEVLLLPRPGRLVTPVSFLLYSRRPSTRVLVLALLAA
jgi:hypothetical protein